MQTKKPARFLSRAFTNNPGGFLLSHTVARAVPSAPRGLTSVFGMGTGVALSTQPPENFSKKDDLWSWYFGLCNPQPELNHSTSVRRQRPKTKVQRPKFFR